MRDGTTAGQVTSAAWGASVGSSVGLAWLWSADRRVVDADWVREGRYEVDVAGARHPVTVTRRALVDPAGERVRPSPQRPPE